jgi:hypothetical protein
MNEGSACVLRNARFADEWDGLAGPAAALFLEDPSGHAFRARDRTLRPVVCSCRVLPVCGAGHLREPVGLQEARLDHAASFGWH